MKTLAAALLCALLAGCGTSLPSPIASAAAIPTSTPSPTVPSPSPSLTIAFTCYRDPVPTPRDPAYLPSSYCPAEEVAVETALAHLGHPAQRITVAWGGFPCGQPFGSGMMACPIAAIGTVAYAAFVGTDEVAALTIALLPNGPVVATVVAFEVPPSGWSIP
jgi:hypothetical protein